jgi:cysteine desulfurase/selenocysteine lyase
VLRPALRALHLQHFGLASTYRASLALYNTHAEIERFMAALAKARKLLG